MSGEGLLQRFVFHYFYKEPMNPAVCGKFGMEGRCHDRSLADEDRKSLALGKDFDSWADFRDARSANEDHFERSPGERSIRGKDARVNLTPIRIALDEDIQKAERTLRRIENLARQQNGPGTGAEDRPLRAERAQRLKKVVPVEKAQHGGGFATGQDQSLKAGEFLGLAHFNGLRSGFC